MDILDQAQQKNTDTQPSTDIPDLSSLMHPEIDQTASSVETPPQVESAPVMETTNFSTMTSVQATEPVSEPSTSPPSVAIPEPVSSSSQSTFHEDTLPPSAPIEPPEALYNGIMNDSLIPPIPPPIPPVPPKSHNKFPRAILLAVILLLLITVPIIGFFASRSQQVADIRNRAVDCRTVGAPCEVTCNDNSHFGPDACPADGAFDSCTQWKDQACNRDHGGWGGGTQPTAPPGGGFTCPDGNRQSCDSVNHCDVAGDCNAACGAQNETKGNEVCDVPNGYCKSGYSCRPNGVGTHLTCANNQCVNQLCPNSAASCANDCSSNTQCQSNGTNPTATPASGSCLITNTLTGGSVTVSAGCPAMTLQRAYRSASPGSTSESCIGTSDNQTSTTEGPFTSARTFTATGTCGQCVQIDIVDNNGRVWGTAIYTGDCVQPTNTPTPVPALCQNIKIYRDGTLLTTSQYNSIKSGDELTLASVSVSSSTKARFTINNALPQETTTKNNSGEYILSYIVPSVSSETQFTIQAEIFTDGAWR